MTKKPPTPLPPVADADGVLPVKLLREHPDNPRKTFVEAELAEMAASMKPPGRVDIRLVVRAVGVPGGPEPRYEDGAWHDLAHFQVLDGHKRLRAARLAGLREVPVEVVALDDAAAYLLMVRAFAQRSDPPVSEQAAAFGRLADGGLTAERVAAETGKPLSFVRAALRLARLPAWALAAVDRGVLPRATAELVARVPGAESRAKAAACVLLSCSHPDDLEEPWDDADTWQEAVEGIGKGGPWLNVLTFRATRELIREHFTRELKAAPFDRKALYVIDTIDAEGQPHDFAPPPCEPCPDRAGNDPEATTDGARADTCLNPDCYAAKVRAYRAGVLADAADKNVLDADLGVEGFERPPRGWCRLDAEIPETELDGDFAAVPLSRKLQKLKALLGRLCPQRYVAFGRGGKAVYLVKTADARRALVDAGVLARPEPRRKPAAKVTHKQAAYGPVTIVQHPDGTAGDDLPDAPAPAARGAGAPTEPWEEVPKAEKPPAGPSGVDIAGRAALIAARVLKEYGAEQCSALDDVAEVPDADHGGPVHDALRFVAEFLIRDHCEFGSERADAVRLAFGIPSDGPIPPTHGAEGRAKALARQAVGAADGLSSSGLLGACLALISYPLLAERHDNYKPLTDPLLGWAEMDWEQLEEQARRELTTGETADAKVDRALADQQQQAAAEPTTETPEAPDTQAAGDQQQPAADEPAYACEAGKKQLGGGPVGKRAKKKGKVPA